MKNYFLKIIGKKHSLLVIYILLALGASIQSLDLGSKSSEKNESRYTMYNNYIIFKMSFDHLKMKQDLYVAYPNEHWDLFKYTPTFAAFFGVFSIMPDWAGLTLWNLLNALLLLFAIYYLPSLTYKQKGLILIIIAIEVMTSIQNEQSNALIAGLLVFSFGLLEKKKCALAALCIVFSAFIKLFGIVGFALFLLYPERWKLAFYSTLWTLTLSIIPLIWLDSNEYLLQLKSYGKMLTNDHSTSYGYSVMGWLKSWFLVDVNRNFIVLGGVVLFLLPLARMKMFKESNFKLLTLISILIWVVIFNHKAESPTFVIAVTGLALWFVSTEKSTLNIVLFISAMILTVLSPTDIFPAGIRSEWVHPYVLKAVPCILIWVKVVYDMMQYDPVEQNQFLLKES